MKWNVKRKVAGLLGVLMAFSLTMSDGAATLVNYTGLETDKSFRNSAAYIQSWLKALKNDKKMIVSAASKADKAVSFILGIETE